MSYTLYGFLLGGSLFFGMLILIEVGRRIGVRRRAEDPEGARAGFGIIEGAVFALLGLLLAFTVSGAGARFDARRRLIVEETNAIGTAYLRLGMLPSAAQPGLRENFRRYVDARLEVYRKDVGAATDELARGAKLQGEIWRQAVSSVRADGALPQAPTVLLPALNAMIDIATTRTMGTQMHPPMIIFVMLFVLALVSALLSGYAMTGNKSRSWLNIVCFALIISVTVYVILDLEYPRIGLIRMDVFNQALVELRETMR
jgi:hypothetical protein